MILGGVINSRILGWVITPMILGEGVLTPNNPPIYAPALTVHLSKRGWGCSTVMICVTLFKLKIKRIVMKALRIMHEVPNKMFGEFFSS